METEPALETLGAFIEDRYASWARPHVGDDAVARLKEDFADWLTEPLSSLSAWRIETWRRDRLASRALPIVVERQLRALDGCLSKAVEWQLIERNPLRDVGGRVMDCFVELFAGGIGHGCLREGWAPIGVNWTWTLGKRAILELPPLRADSDCICKLHIAGIFQASAQRIIVSVNEATVGMVFCSGPASYEFFVPARTLGSRDHIALIIETPDARRPMDHQESTDDRFLGLRVAKIELRPVAKIQEKNPLHPPAVQDAPGLLEQRGALQDMASLGFNCEFGFVQRYMGAEPMSLFRWSSVPIDKLISGLERRFEGLNARDALDVQVNENGEFVVEDKVYGFRHHTFVFQSQGGVLERVQKNEYVRVGVLCKTLLEELREHKKLFVYHDADASQLADVQRLVRALNTYGNNMLLWISSAPAASRIGETRQMEPGLIRGYVSGFQTNPITPRSPHLSSWITVACRAHKIWSAARESQEQRRLAKQLQSR